MNCVRCVIYTTLSPITDIDECADGDQNECDPNALCTNTEGSYVCRCLRGYKGDGRNCTGMFLLLLFLLFLFLLFFLCDTLALKLSFQEICVLIMHFLFSAVTRGCSPLCGPNAFCQQSDGFSVCECNAGYLGDGYNCTGTFMSSYAAHLVCSTYSVLSIY